MQKYLDSYKQMISLRDLTDHTIKSYSTYLNAYLNYLKDILHKLPEDVSWEELRGFILWLQQQRSLKNYTIKGGFFGICLFHFNPEKEPLLHK